MRRTPSFRDPPGDFLHRGRPVGPGRAGFCRFPARGQVPGPESFAKEPQNFRSSSGTRSTTWSRTGQAKQAAPYLDKFLKSKPRRRHAAPDPRPLRRRVDPPARRRARDAGAMPRALTQMVNEASRRNANPARADRSVHQCPDEIVGGADLCSRAAPRGGGRMPCPSLLKAIDRPNLPREERALLVYKHGAAGPLGRPPPDRGAWTAPTGGW